MKIAICAGKEDGHLLKEMLNEHSGKAERLDIDAFTRREDMLYRMKEKHYDVVIVALPGAMGMETAMSARQFDEDAALVWASNETAFIAESYRLRAAMFLSLPLVSDQVDEALLRVGVVTNK